MKRIMPMSLKLVHLDESDSQRRVKIAFHRIFTIARNNITKSKQSKGGDNNVVNQECQNFNRKSSN